MASVEPVYSQAHGHYEPRDGLGQEKDGKGVNGERRWLTTILARIRLHVPGGVALFGLGKSNVGNVP